MTSRVCFANDKEWLRQELRIFANAGLIWRNDRKAGCWKSSPSPYQGSRKGVVFPPNQSERTHLIGYSPMTIRSLYIDLCMKSALEDYSPMGPSVNRTLNRVGSYFL